MPEERTDVLVVGGGLGGVAAALAAVERGADVVLVEETAWLGGRLTSQAVPAVCAP
jgi:NADPH-dependent 2,4-dienoyl-CoA reductase/sulfur reductase-like enzyme